MPKKRADGRYAKQITIGHKDGKPIKKTIYGRTLKELDANVTEFRNLIEKGTRLDLIKVTVSDLMDEWYKTRENDISMNTQRRYRSYFNAAKPLIGELKVTEVKRFHIESMLASIKERGNSSAHEYFQLTKKFFRYAVESDIIYKNPCDGISVRYSPKVKRILTKEELEKIDDCDLVRHDKALLYLLRYTGMRIGEVLALQKSDANREDLTIRVKKTVVSGGGVTKIQEYTKTEAGTRIVPIFLPLIKPLFDYIDHLPPEQEQLFISARGCGVPSPTSGGHMFKRILRDCGITDSEITPHYMRHNFISECYRAGIDIKKVQSWVGHVDIRTTLNTYTHIGREMVKNGDDMNSYYDSQKSVKEVFKGQEKPYLRAL